MTHVGRASSSRGDRGQGPSVEKIWKLAKTARQQDSGSTKRTNLGSAQQSGRQHARTFRNGAALLLLLEALKRRQQRLRHLLVRAGRQRWHRRGVRRNVV